MEFLFNYFYPPLLLNLWLSFIHVRFRNYQKHIATSEPVSLWVLFPIMYYSPGIRVVVFYSCASFPRSAKYLLKCCPNKEDCQTDQYI